MTGRDAGDDSPRAKLMSRVKAMQNAGPPDYAAAGDPTDFLTLPGYDDLRVQRAVGAQLGLADPYFREHDAKAGARTLIGNREYLNFSCYDYLGLNHHPDVIAAAERAIERYGVSASASRVVAGERPAHRDLEASLAAHYGADDSLVFVSGYATNVGVIGQLVGPNDLVIYDAASHNSVVMGGVMSGATRRSFAHNDLGNLEAILDEIRGKFHRTLIVAEGLYSMDGDYPDLARLVAIKKKYKAWLMIDEAHALGVLGRAGGGIFEHAGVDPRDVDVWMGTLSKTLAGCGGYIAGSETLVEYLRSMCHAFVYSVAMPPVIAAAAGAALAVMHREPERVAQLQANSRRFFARIRSHGLNAGSASGTPVCPVVVGDSISAVLLSQRMFERDINVLPVLYPAVAPKTARLRFFITTMHSDSDLDHAADVVAEEIAALPALVKAMNLPDTGV